MSHEPGDVYLLEYFPDIFVMGGHGRVLDGGALDEHGMYWYPAIFVNTVAGVLQFTQLPDASTYWSGKQGIVQDEPANDVFKLLQLLNDACIATLLFAYCTYRV